MGKNEKRVLLVEDEVAAILKHGRILETAYGDDKAPSPIDEIVRRLARGFREEMK